MNAYIELLSLSISDGMFIHPLHIIGIPYAPFKDPWIVLKKKYLDEKCAVAKGVPAVPPPSSGASAHHHHYNNSSIGIGMSHHHMIEQGRGQHMIPVGTILNVINNYQVATSSSTTTTTTAPKVNSIHATSGKENIWQTAATLALSASNKDAFSSVTSASSASSYPPTMPPPQPIVALSSIQSGHSLPPPVGMMKRIDHSSSASASSAAAVHTLTGQGWYVQSAGRAVNQCIGRVIRHNRDWGTVFLLDDRFSSDAQLSQLSQWIRPRVKKYKGFNEAIKDFRSYMTAVVQDPSLNASKTTTGNYVAASSHRVSSAASRSDRSGDSMMKGSDCGGGDDGGGFMFFKRHVVIKRDALEGTDDDNTFIDPSFLATQQSVGDVHCTTGSSIDVIDNTHRSIQYQKQYLKHQQHNDESSSAVGVNKLMDTMNQLRSKPLILSDKDSINNSNKGILSSGAIDSFLIKTQQKQSSFGLQTSSSTSLSSSSILMKTEKTIPASLASSSVSSSSSAAAAATTKKENIHPFFQKIHNDSSKSSQPSSSSSSSTQNRKMYDQSESSSSSSQASFQLSQASSHLSQSSSSHHKISHSQLSRSSSNRLDTNKMDFNELIGIAR